MLVFIKISETSKNRKKLPRAGFEPTSSGVSGGGGNLRKISSSPREPEMIGQTTLTGQVINPLYESQQIF